MVDKGVGFLVSRVHLVLAVAALRDSAKGERGAEPPIATELRSISELEGTPNDHQRWGELSQKTEGVGMAAAPRGRFCFLLKRNKTSHKRAAWPWGPAVPGLWGRGVLAGGRLPPARGNWIQLLLGAHKGPIEGRRGSSTAPAFGSRRSSQLLKDTRSPQKGAGLGSAKGIGVGGERGARG